MEGKKLTCNYKGCRQALENIAWVTNCYHVFCNDHGSLLVKSAGDCQACGAHLSADKSIVKVNLNPREYYKNMVLIGLHPEVVLEVCRRAVSFWCYQMEQERRFQAHVIKRYKEGLKATQNYYEQQLRMQEDQRDNLKRQYERSQQELQRTLEQKNILNEKLNSYQPCQISKSAHKPVRKNTGISVVDELIAYKIPHGSSKLNPAATSSLLSFPPMDVKESNLLDNTPKLSHLDMEISHSDPSLSTVVQRQASRSGMDIAKVANNFLQAQEVHPLNANAQNVQCCHHQQAPAVKHTGQNVCEPRKDPLSAPPSPWIFNPSINCSRQISISAPAISSDKSEEFVFAPVLQGNRNEREVSTQNSNKSF